MAPIAAAQREIADSEKHLRDIADNLLVLIDYISNERNFTFAHQAFAQWIGLDPEQLKGKPVAALGTSIHEERSGVVRNLHTVLVPDLRSDGHVAGVYALGTDVSAIKRPSGTCITSPGSTLSRACRIGAR